MTISTYARHKRPVMPPSPPAGARNQSSSWSLTPTAYAQLALPILTSLCILAPTLKAVLLATATVSAFLGYDAILRLLDRKGAGFSSTSRLSTAFRAAAFGLIFASACAFALQGAEPGVLSAAKIVTAPLFCIALLIVLNQKHSLPEELLFASTLSLAAAPIALLSGVSWQTAGAGALICAICLGMGVFAVHAIMERKEPSAVSIRWSTVVTLVIGIAVIFTALPFALLGSLWVAALIPSAAASMVVLLVGSTPEHLRGVGWALSFAHLISSLMLIFGLQQAQLSGALFL